MNNSNIGRGGGGGGGGRGGFGGGGGFHGGMGGQGFARSPMGNTGVVGPAPRVGPPAGRIVDRASFERAAAMQNSAARQQQTGSFARRPGPGPGPHPSPGSGHRPRPYPRRFGGFAYTYPNYNVYYGYPGYFAESCQTAYLAWQNAVAAGADVATVATLKAAFESCLYTNSVAPLGFI